MKIILSTLCAICVLTTFIYICRNEDLERSLRMERYDTFYYKNRYECEFNENMKHLGTIHKLHNELKSFKNRNKK